MAGRDGVRRTLKSANMFALQVSDGLAGLVVMLLMLGVTMAVVLRQFDIAVIGVIEVGGLSLIYLTLLAAPNVAARDDNVKVDLIDGLLSRRVLNAVDVFSTLLQIGVTGVLLWASAQLVLTDIERGTTIGGELGLSRWLVGIVVPIASALILIQLVRRLIHLLEGHRDEAVPHERDNQSDSELGL